MDGAHGSIRDEPDRDRRRLADPNVTDDERARVRRLVRRAVPGTAA
jgi:hypothetical protein